MKLLILSPIVMILALYMALFYAMLCRSLLISRIVFVVLIIHD